MKHHSCGWYLSTPQTKNPNNKSNDDQPVKSVQIFHQSCPAFVLFKDNKPPDPFSRMVKNLKGPTTPTSSCCVKVAFSFWKLDIIPSSDIILSRCASVLWAFWWLSVCLWGGMGVLSLKQSGKSKISTIRDLNHCWWKTSGKTNRLASTSFKKKPLTKKQKPTSAMKSHKQQKQYLAAREGEIPG